MRFLFKIIIEKMVRTNSILSAKMHGLKKAVIRPKLIRHDYFLESFHNEGRKGKTLRRVPITEYKRRGRLIERFHGDNQILQLNKDGTVKKVDSKFYYYKRDCDVRRDRQTGSYLSRHKVNEGDVVQIIIPDSWGFGKRADQKLLYGVIDDITTDDQERDGGCIICVKFHAMHENVFFDEKGNMRTLNKEWVMVDLADLKFVKRNAEEGKDVIGLEDDSDEYYKSLGYETLPPHRLIRFLGECDYRQFFEKK